MKGEKLQSEKARVLVVDDDQDLREFCSHGIGEAGMEPVAFAEPVDAIDYLTSGVRIDAVLTDLALPQMSGLDLARLIARARPDLPVVMMTGYPDRLEEAIAIGILPLVKPFTIVQLVAALNDALGRPKVPRVR